MLCMNDVGLFVCRSFFISFLINFHKSHAAGIWYTDQSRGTLPQINSISDIAAQMREYFTR